MTTSTTVTDVHGPMNTGSGHQFNIVMSPDGTSWRLRVGGRDPRAAARDDQRWLLQRFVEPPNYGRALATMADNGAVLLTGPPGAGRHATARMLLHWLPGPYVPYREVSDRAEPDEPVLDAGMVEAGERLLLNLSDTEDERFPALLPRLSSYRAEVRERGAHLVVVLRSGRERGLGADLGSLVVEIGRPDGRSVLLRYLRVDRVPYQPSHLDDPDLLPHLASAPIGRIASLAGLIRASRDGGTGAFPAWLAAALRAVSDQDGEVANRLRTLVDGRQRALFVAGAMLSGAPAEAVHHAAAALLATTGFPPDERPALARPSLAQELADIKVDIDRTGRIRFGALGYDRAARTHFWTYFPDLRDDFRDWIGDAAGLPALDGTDRDELVTRFAEQALRIGRPNDLVVLVERWAGESTGGPSPLLPQAATALVLGLSHPRHGRVFRRRIYDWSQDPRLSRSLIELVVRMCVDVLDMTHPDQALVRLHHLARRQGGTAVDALWELAVRDGRQYRRLLDRVVTGLSLPRPWQVDIDLFLALARPSQVRTTGAATREQLVAGWHVLLGLPDRHWRASVGDWLAGSVDDDRLLTILVDAGGHRPDVLSRLYVVARDWAREDDREVRVPIAARLAARIDVAQGIELAEETT